MAGDFPELQQVHVFIWSEFLNLALSNLVNAWIKAMTKDDANKAREALLKAIESREREYLIDFD
jgi:hypothetical protein